MFFGSNLLFVFFPIMYITGGETFSVKDQVVNSSSLAGHAVSVSAANGDCVPVRLKCSKQVAVKIGTLSMSLPVFCLLHLLASDRMDQNFPCLLWIYSLYSQYVSEKLNTVVPLFISRDCSSKRFYLCSSCLLPQ